MNRNVSYALCTSILILGAVSLTLSACMTVSDTKTVVPSTNSGREFNNKKIAVLPVKVQTSLAPDSVMPLRVELNKRLGPMLSNKLPSASVSDMPAVTNQLNQKGALPVLEQLFSTHENTGVLDKRHTVALGHALGSDYLLLSRLKSEKMDLAFISKGMGASLELMLVNVDTAEVAWSGNGEWKRGGIFGTGGAPPAEAADNLVKLAFSSLQSSREISRTPTEKPPTAPSRPVAESQETLEKPPTALSRPIADVQKTPEMEPNQKTETLSVGEVQKRLLELGYKPGPADGKMGPSTIRALKKFQQDNNLSMTGQANSETVAKLLQKKKAYNAER